MTTSDRVDGEVSLQDIEGSNGVDVGLLVGGIDLGTLLVDGGKKGSDQFELKTLYTKPY